MRLKAIDPSKLNSNANETVLWFQGDDAEVQIKIHAKIIKYFEISYNNKHLEGGFDFPLKSGEIIDGKEELKHKKSRLINFDNTDKTLKSYKSEFIKLLESCDSLEEEIKIKIIEFIINDGKNNSILKADLNFKSFQLKTNSLSRIKSNLSVKKVAGVFLLLAIVFSIVLPKITGVKNLEIQCSKKEYSSCLKLAKIKAFLLNFEESNLLYKKSKELEPSVAKLCSHGDIDACQKLSELERIKFFKTWCEENKGAVYCMMVGEIYSKMGKDEKAKSMFLKSCQSKYAPACNQFLRYTKFDGLKLDCEKGSMSSCYEVAKVHESKGHFKKAYDLFKKSCDTGLDKGCFEQAKLELRKGNKKIALDMFKVSCNKTLKEACFSYNYAKEDSSLGRQILIRNKRLCGRGNEDSCKKAYGI